MLTLLLCALMVSRIEKLGVMGVRGVYSRSTSQSLTVESLPPVASTMPS